MSSLINTVSDRVASGRAPLSSPAAEERRFGFAQTAQTENKVPSTAQLRNAGQHDPFWEFTEEEIDASRWNKRYPYQLLVLNAEKDGSYSVDGQWSFVLPIPPESLSISTPFAINTSATLGGIVEEHNGAPFRMINISGTTGVLPNKESAASNPLLGLQASSNQFTGGAFAGTIQTASAAIVNGATGLGFAQYNLMSSVALSGTGLGDLGRGTGYYQFRLLQKFLEGYVNMKKRGGNSVRNKRLALANWKDQAVYLVSPANFEMRKDASNDPLAYKYALSFKAWRRVPAATGGPNPLKDIKSKINDPTVLQRVLQGLSDARGVLAAAKNVLEAVRGDVDQVLFEPIRQSVMFCKDGLGLALSAAELPANVLADAKTAVVAAVGLPGATKDAMTQAAISGNRVGQASSDLNNAFLGTNTSNIGVRAPSATSQALSGSAEPANKLFEDPVGNLDTFAAVDVTKLSLSPATKKKLDAEVGRVRKLQRVDFETMRDNLQKVAADFADAIGESSATYNTAFGRPSVTSTKLATDEDFDVLFALNNSILEMSRMAVNGPQPQARLQAVEYIAGLARKSGIAFTTPISKFLVPLPYGVTLEQLSARYLGDPNRWHEIVALNGLRAPYIDETGHELPLLTNGRFNQVTIQDPTNLYVGQAVTLSASNAPRSKRRITRIDPVSPVMTTVYLDGDENLEAYGPIGNAVLHTYLPDTVNSQMQLYIPSQTPTTGEDLTAKAIPGVNDFADLLEAGGVDLLLTPSGDLAVTPDGDCRLAVGQTNLIQRVRTALATPRGSLPQHPEFGLGLKAGVSTADLDARGLLEATRGLFRDDPSFTGVTAAQVMKSGVGVRLNVTVGIAGQDNVLPVSVDVRR